MPRPFDSVLYQAGPRRLVSSSELDYGLGSDLAALPASSVVNDPNLAWSLATDVLPGETVIFFAASRSGAPIGITSVLGLPLDSTTEILRFDVGGSPTVNLVRVYFPTGAATGLAGTMVWSANTSKKALVGWRYRGLVNQPAIAFSSATATNATGTSGTTQAIPAAYLPAVHVGVFGWGGALVPQTARSLVDEEGTVEQIANIFVGASTGLNFLAQHRRVIQAAKPSGLTFTALSNFSSTFAGLQAVWSTVDVEAQIPRAKPRFMLGGFRVPILPARPALDFPAPAGGGDITIVVGAAAADASAMNPTIQETLLPASTSSTGSALGPGVTLTVPPATAASTAAAPTPALVLTVPPAVATATASGLAPTITLSVLPGVGASSASAFGPTLRLNVLPGVATSSASALGPQASLIVAPAIATASASGLAPAILLIVTPSSGSASASAPIPTLLIGLFILPAVAGASASALTPTLQSVVLPAFGAATSQGRTPTLQTTVAPAAASSTASALVAVQMLRVRIFPPRGFADGSASTPTLVITQVGGDTGIPGPHFATTRTGGRASTSASGGSAPAGGGGSAVSRTGGYARPQTGGFTE